jgi:carbamoyltransferase
LGINSAHDASACLLVGGELRIAIPEERLSRVKYHEGFPYKAVEHCLSVAGLESLNSVDCVVMNEYPFTDFDLELRKGGYGGRLITNPSHHLLHAYYAWAASGATDVAILIVDGSGYHYGEYVRQDSPMLGPAPEFSEMEEAESRYVVRDGRLELTGKRWALWEATSPYYRFGSLGHMYSIVTQYIFGHWKHAGKTMGLAPYGDAGAFPEPFVDLSGPEMVIHTEWATRLPPRSSALPEDDRTCRDLAAKVQAELERAMLWLADRMYAETGQERLCISGGVGLNSVTNGRILRESKFSHLFITPAAGDAGISIGAALYGHHQLTGAMPVWRYTDDYHGRRYEAAEVTGAIGRYASRLRVEDPLDASAAAARDISSGAVVGWFEGGCEFGPRSLGHRSILCDPRGAQTRDRLNTTVKFREPFRPYAASVLAEHAADYFDLGVDDPFMLIVAPVPARYRDVIPAVCHVDGTCRIQTVRPDHPGRFRRLIEEFHALTELPLVLNTSFNIRGEPIVETPDEAIECFLGSNIDVLYIEGRRLTKVVAATADRPGALVPRLNAGLTLGVVVATDDGRALEPRHHVQTRTGHRATLTPAEYDLLCAVDGAATVAELAAGHTDPAATAATFAALQRRGLVSFEYTRD